MGFLVDIFLAAFERCFTIVMPMSQKLVKALGTVMDSKMTVNGMKKIPKRV